MKFFYLILLIIVTLRSVSQSEIHLCVTDSLGIPISYVEYGIIGVIGNVTDIHGNLYLDIENDNVNDTLTISCIGYSLKKISISEALNLDTIVLLNKFNKLDNVIINKNEYKTKEIGFDRYKNFTYTLRYPAKVASVIDEYNDDDAYIYSIRFYIKKHEQKAKLRITLYTIDKKTHSPKTILNKKDIIFKIKKDGWNNIELKETIKMPDSGLICSFQILDNDKVDEVLFGGHISPRNEYKNKILDSFYPHMPWQFFSFEDQPIFLTLAVTLKVIIKKE